jgi:hypothetical protein
LRNPACGEFRAARSVDFDVWAEIRVALAAVIATRRQVVQEEIEGNFMVD